MHINFLVSIMRLQTLLVSFLVLGAASPALAGVSVTNRVGYELTKTWGRTDFEIEANRHSSSKFDERYEKRVLESNPGDPTGTAFESESKVLGQGWTMTNEDVSEVVSGYELADSVGVYRLHQTTGGSSL